MRRILKYGVTNTDNFKRKLLFWSSQYNRVAYLDSHHVDMLVNSKKEYNSYELLVGVDQLDEMICKENAFENLQSILEVNPDWWFGFLSYDLKNQVEDLFSKNQDGILMPDIHFFCPRWVFALKGNELEIHISEEVGVEALGRSLFEAINHWNVFPESSEIELKVAPRISRDNYLESVKKIKEHIQRGDIYELNFCQEFYSQTAKVNPYAVYADLKTVSPTPYSCFYRLDEKFLMSASPERFLKKIGDKLISQPIKGTAPRGVNDNEDEAIKRQLFNDPKERAENIMIVDLVRNDLSRSAQKGSVHVEELCGIYTFPQVHQMISTVVSKLNEDIHFVEAIKRAFPMGSMTGAPKVSAMKLIEKYESTKRGVYSGAVGYITPQGDFDFNVVIRSILYDAVSDYLSFMVGGAITMQSEPEKEYDECILKAKAILEVLGAKL